MLRRLFRPTLLACASLATTAAAAATPRTVLITGAAKGIGAATAQKFAGQGHRVILHYRSNQAEADAVCQSLSPCDDAAHVCLQATLDEPGAPEALIKAALEVCDGKLDVLVCNHGLYEETPVETASATEWSQSFARVLRTNLAAPAELAFAFGSAARARGDHSGAAIVFVSSRGAYRGEPLAPAYGASKAGINALTGSLAQSFGPYGIRVSAVAPGFIATAMAEGVLASPRGEGIRNQSPWGRVGEPCEVANAVYYLASEDATWSTGAILDCNGASYLH